MNLDTKISSIRDLLINSELSEAINTTSELVDEIGKDSFNYSIYLIHEQYNQLVRDNVEGNLNREHMLLERNKITLSVLQLLQSIQYQETEEKKKPFIYAQAAIAALALLLIISVAYIFLGRSNNAESVPNTANLEQPENAMVTIVNSHPEEVLYSEDTILQELNIPTNDSYFDAIPEEVGYQQNIFDLSEDEFGITLRFVDDNKSIDELIEAPIQISISRLKKKLIRHFDLEKSDFLEVGSSGEWQLFANDKKISKENRNLEGAGLFDYDLITIKYIDIEKEGFSSSEYIDGQEFTSADIDQERDSDVADLRAEATLPQLQKQENTALASLETPPAFPQGKIDNSTRPPARTVEGSLQIPEVRVEEIDEEDARKKENVDKKNRSKEKDGRKKEALKNSRTFSYLIFVPGEISLHLRQSKEVFDTKTDNYYTRNSFTEEDLNLLTNRKLLIRDRDGQKLYTSLRSSGNQYFVAIEGGVGASEEDFYTLTVAGRKMAAVPISSKEYDRLLKVANSTFKGPRVDNVSVKNSDRDFTRKSIILSKK